MARKLNNPKKTIYKRTWFIGFALILILGGFGNAFDDTTSELPNDNDNYKDSLSLTTETFSDIAASETTSYNSESTAATETINKTTSESITTESDTYNDVSQLDSILFNGKEYKVHSVDGGDLSGKRLPNVAVNIGFGNREYWAFTNDNAQLVFVTAKKIILQDPSSEAVLSNGRYFEDEAKVPGVESDDLDEGHVIADSLGGVSNAYNITPQDSTLNRYGDQAYMEKVIRDAGGCDNFMATITYPSSNTQVPSHYKFEYELFGNKIVDEFDNVNPEKVNESIDTTETLTNTQATEPNATAFNEVAELGKVDSNKNGKVTIAEAKAAGYKMPIYRDHWLYKYMDDRDGDGMVGE